MGWRSLKKYKFKLHTLEERGSWMAVEGVKLTWPGVDESEPCEAELVELSNEAEE